jgi:hypothetical protein
MKATKKAAVTETKVVEIEPAKIILELTEIEAKALGAMVGSISDSRMQIVCVQDATGLRINAREIPHKFNHTFYNKICSLFR